jgi:hypothetical protein
MIYILLLTGLFVALAALYRFFLGASARQVKAMFLSVAALAIGCAGLFLALTGRLPAAIAILVALWPVGIAYFRNRPVTDAGNSGIELTEKEAYEVLGLPKGAPPEDVREAHIRLMKKVHPDQQGSDWLAKKINAAKDLLLKSS